MTGTETTGEVEPTARQRAVLDAVLSLMVENGEQLTMDAVARRASCSKESLYKWFGNRDGLLAAAVRRQAAGVRAGPAGRARLDEGALRESLRDFAATWLATISSATSIALNRLAIAHAGSAKDDLGSVVLANGRFAVGERLRPVLEEARAAGLLSFDDAETAFRTFFGLVARDVHIRLLLGDRLRLTRKEIERDAAGAAEQFLALYGTPAEPP